MVELLAYSGMRLSEAAALTWADIDFDDGTFFVRATGHAARKCQPRRVPLFPAMRVLLQRLQKRRRGGIKPDDRVLLTRECRCAFARARRSAGGPEFTLHCLRHFFAVNALTQGIECELIAAWMGYTDGGLQVARLYGEFHEDPKEMAERMTYMAEARYEAPPMPRLRLPSFKSS
jgi:integrase